MACQSANKNNTPTDIDTLAYEVLGKAPTSSDQNETRAFTIYRVESDNNTNYPRIHYLIVNNETAEPVKEGHITMGYIKWVSDNTIEILDLPGAIPSGKTVEDYKVKINLNQK